MGSDRRQAGISWSMIPNQEVIVVGDVIVVGKVMVVGEVITKDRVSNRHGV